MSKSHSLQVICAADCGNAPKKQLLKEFNIAFAKGDTPFILEHVADNILWNQVGSHQVHGKEQFAEELERMSGSSALSLEIHQIITHGNTASANGILTFEGNKRYAFCDVYLFNGFAKTAKIKEIHSYVIHIS